MVDLAAFAETIGGEVTVGCVIATVDGKKQYLFRDGEFSPVGQKLYNNWTEHVSKSQLKRVRVQLGVRK
jgi:hypothetical protein